MNEQDLASAVANALKQQLPAILAQLLPHKQVKPEGQFSTPKIQIQDEALLRRSSSGFSTSSSSSALSRSSSGFSASSFSSAPSQDVSDDEEVVYMGSSKHLSVDKNVVRVPLFNKIDAQYLAPPNSPLFKRFFKKKRNRDGTRSLKNKKQMDSAFFEDLVRPVIRRLLGHAGLNSAKLSSRYFYAAQVLARKRRNNHMSSWRDNGDSCKLIYGGQLPSGCINPYLSKTNSKRKKKLFDVNKNLTVDKEERQPAKAQKRIEELAVDKEERKPVKEEKRIEESQSSDDMMDADCRIVGKPTMTNCTKCGKAFAQDCDDWRRGDDVRCDSCVLSKMDEEITQLHHGELKPKTKTKTKKSKQKLTGGLRKKGKACRCGSTSHFRTTHSSCPLNKKNRSLPAAVEPPAAVAPVEPAAVEPPAAVAPVKSAVVAPKLMTTAESHAENPPPGPAPPKRKRRMVKAQRQILAYNIGSNVLAQFKPKRFYWAHVIKREGVIHDVYFPGDGTVKTGLRPHELRPCKEKLPTRRDMIGVEFEFEGDEVVPPGLWKVRQVVGNAFRCTKIRGPGDRTVDEFDIGYVMRRVKSEQESTRERGPK